MFRNALQRFMYGRYGSDRLNVFLMVVYLVLLVIHMFTGLHILYLLSFGLMVYTLFRTLSRNRAARSRENARFLHLTAPINRWFRLRRTILRDREHRYFKCPSCGQHLRVPRNKGRITVTCRSCGTRFDRKS